MTFCIMGIKENEIKRYYTDNYTDALNHMATFTKEGYEVITHTTVEG